MICLFIGMSWLDLAVCLLGCLSGLLTCWLLGSLTPGPVAGMARRATGYAARSSSEAGRGQDHQPSSPSSPNFRSWCVKYTSEVILILILLLLLPGCSHLSPPCHAPNAFWLHFQPSGLHVGLFSVFWSLCWLFLAQLKSSWHSLAPISPNLAPTCPNLCPTSPNLPQLSTNLAPF